MKLLKYGLLIVLLIFLAYLELNPDEKKPTKINTVSLQSPDAKIISRVEQSKPKNVSEPKTIIVTETINDDNSRIDIDPSLDFITAFRNYTYFLYCSNAINNFHEEKDPLKSYIYKLNKVKKYGFEVKEEHFQNYLSHVEKCKDYLVLDTETYEHSLQRLKKTYESIQPDKQEYFDLLEFISLVEIRNQLAKEIDQIKTTNTNQNILHKNEIEIRSISLVNELKELENKIQELMKSSHSPDMFILIFKDVGRVDDTGYSFLSEQLIKQAKIQLKIYDYYNYTEILTRVGLPLYACALGYPCGADSQIIVHQCINNVMVSACNRSVEDYYLNYLISPNIYNDLKKYINFMLENYAK
jgi:hypothetical protein